MKFLDHWMARSRLRAARATLAEHPSAENFAALALEHARIDDYAQAERVCTEGLASLASHPELSRLRARMRVLQKEERARALASELREAPRPGLYRELAEIYLECGRLERAEELAAAWLAAGGAGEAQWIRAEARVARYFADRRREDGRLALELLALCEAALARDERPLRLRLDFVCRVGAWGEARRSVAQLLELHPGDPALEARYRTYTALADGGPTLEAALREVERCGTFPEEHTCAPALPTGPASRPVRSELQQLVAQPSVQVAVFERGATALVQGPCGATAERCARAVREVAQRSRAAARRMGLGSAVEVELEGRSGSLLVLPHDAGVAAVQSSASSLPDGLRPALLALAHAHVEAQGVSSP
ncbi:MAG: hypothetical protein FJ294_10260 [Planctomycetes bacterium]|nr:hypothetical protein [Planctomycetota bacterium]